MKAATFALAVAIAAAIPTLAPAQHDHGGGGMDRQPPREKRKEASPVDPPGLLPMGSARPIEVLVVYYGFSPSVVRADQGEEIQLRLRRSADVLCTKGLTIPGREGLVQLPPGETVPVTLKLDRAGTFTLQCKDEATHASIIVAPRCVTPAGAAACSP
jgi:heme/copper-type cytochrome/quinol oxidase subunit 2